MTEAVLFDARADGIAIITINRPEQRNCLSREVREGLFAAWDRFEKDPALRVAILTGAGDKSFDLLRSVMVAAPLCGSARTDGSSGRWSPCSASPAAARRRPRILAHPRPGAASPARPPTRA